MSFVVEKPGVQATLQASPRRSMRHLGVPASGAADPLSMALANRLVGNASDECALECPLGMVSLRVLKDAAIAITGASAAVEVGGHAALMHQTLFAKAGETVSIGAPVAGARTYIAVAGGFTADEFLGSGSTCLPAGFGGLGGRALKAGDKLGIHPVSQDMEALSTPANMRQVFSNSHALRCVPGPDEAVVAGWEFQQHITATRRADRTGIEITGNWPRPEQAALKQSAPVFPGTVQLTPSGAAFVLLPDAQTTGGYPHILQVARVDRHLLGQIRPGDRIQFLRRSPEDAARELRDKLEYFRDWLPDLAL
nr:biotin-dependent carboxyltransferase family protein [uncultured Hyphomonas sp.]